MIVRTFILAVALLAGAAPAAFAQDAPAAEQSQQEATASALRDVYQALFFDSGMFDAMADHYLPQFRQTITTSPIYQRGNARRRADLDALVARTPELMREEVIAESNAMSNNIAAEVGAIVTPEELRDYADLMRLPLWQRHIDAMARAAAQTNGRTTDYQVEFSPEEQAQLEAMEARPAAQALIRTNGALGDIIDREMRAAGPRIQPRLQQRLAGEFCNLLGRDCPPAMRAMSQP